MELIDLIDEHDRVVGTTVKEAAHAKRLPHRVAAVLVFTEAGELYVQVHKKSGGKFDHSVGGHVIKGEDYQTAAVREADEELGIRQPLTYMTTFYNEAGSYRHMFGLFECVADKTWRFVPNEEVDEIIPMKLADVRALMKSNPEKFTTGFIKSMQVYTKLKNHRP